ncbi:hypothetical protein [Enterococcus sp. DIV0756]|uniref:hypothetical protein n=1 Tax=Enterococcus sp. DIV0756 TaxID=2774636 RepID=UPI003F21B8E7
METAEKKFKFSDIKLHLVAGTNYMLPIIIVGALFTAVVTFMPESFPLFDFFKFISTAGLERFDIFCCMFIAYSVADRVALAPAFMLALYANQNGLGIFGAIIIGLLVGYISVWMGKLPLKGSGKALFSLVVIPTVVTLGIGMISVTIVQQPILFINEWLKTFLTSLYGSNAIALGLILGAMIGFDLGGPVNKVAGLFALTMLNEGVRWPITMATAAFMVPSMSVGLATVIDRKGRFFDEDEKVAGTTSFLMSFLLMSEPAIPFMLVDPKFMIPLNMLSCGVLCSIYAMFGITSTVAFGPLIGFAYSSHPIIGVISVLAVVLVAAIFILIRRKFLVQKGIVEL